METLYLSRRNLLSLLSKLDRARQDPGSSQCAIIKYANPGEYTQSMQSCMVVAIEDDEAYADRLPGEMHSAEERELRIQRLISAANEVVKADDAHALDQPLIDELRTATYQAVNTAVTCPKCGKHWDDHEFGVPAPQCP